ncbi:hypothetical protein CBF23_013930 [Marinomonas agarivorans]|nr:hypothetical protein CBF23_013930 [Marinomonas agarivorans]
MKSSLLYTALIGGALMLAGCQTSGMNGGAFGRQCSGIAPCASNPTAQGPAGFGAQPAQGQYIARKQPQPIVVSATGYAAPMMSKKISKAQARLLTLRGSKIDAYRNLSERVYGLKLSGSSSLRSMMTAHDELQTFVDAYLMGAKVVSQRELEDGSFETIVEMALQESFQQCVQSPTTISSNPACQMAYNNINRNQTQQPAPAKPTTTNFYSVE